METLGPISGWESVRGLRAGLQPSALAAVCGLGSAPFRYSAFVQAIHSASPDELRRARIFHYRDAAIVIGVLRKVGRDSYQLTAGAQRIHRMPSGRQARMMGRLALSQPDVQVVCRQLFGSPSEGRALLLLPQGRSSIVVAGDGRRPLPERPSRAIGGLLDWLTRTGVAQALRVTVDPTTELVTDELVLRAINGRLFGLVGHRAVGRERLVRMFDAEARRGPNFRVAAIPRLTRRSVEEGVAMQALKDALMRWHATNPASVRLLELNQAVGLFGVPYLSQARVKASALEAYLRDGRHLYSHVYRVDEVPSP